MPCRLVTLSVIRPLRPKMKLVNRQAFFYPSDFFDRREKTVVMGENYNRLKEEMAG